MESLGSSIAEVAAGAGPAVVGRGRGWDVGSGFVVAAGRVVVASGPASRASAVAFSDGRREAAEVVGVDDELGLAVLSVATGGVEPLGWAVDQDANRSPAIGDPVVALASPGGRGLRATLGFVASSAAGFRGPRGRHLHGAIEHTAPLPRGSVGGPLVDFETRLVGINMVRVSNGLILALPADAALRGRLDALAQGRSLPTRTIGVAVAPPRASRAMRHAVGLPQRDGVIVRAVEEGSPGERAGVRRGDLITAAGGRPVTGVDVLHEALDALEGDAPLPLKVVRGTDEHELSVPFGPEPEESR